MDSGSSPAMTTDVCSAVKEFTQGGNTWPKVTRTKSPSSPARPDGIGQAFAKRLAEDGVHIAVVDLGDGSDTVKLVEAAGRQAIAVKCDVSSEDSVAAMAKDGATPNSATSTS